MVFRPPNLSLRLLPVLLALPLAWNALPAGAENIIIPLGRQGAAVNNPLPHKGMDKSAVRALLGEPRSESAAVGEPPISSWDYGEFRVFFEYDHVIHVVKKHRPRHPEAID